MTCTQKGFSARPLICKSLRARTWWTWMLSVEPHSSHRFAKSRCSSSVRGPQIVRGASLSTTLIFRASDRLRRSPKSARVCSIKRVRIGYGITRGAGERLVARRGGIGQSKVGRPPSHEGARIAESCESFGLASASLGTDARTVDRDRVATLAQSTQERFGERGVSEEVLPGRVG